MKERLRCIKDPMNVRLLYDVLQYDPPEIKKAVLFVTNNALVCDTQEDAMKVAYEMEDGERYDAVALDGTFYQKSGLISGGSRYMVFLKSLVFYSGNFNIFLCIFSCIC